MAGAEVYIHGGTAGKPVLAGRGVALASEPGSAPENQPSEGGTDTGTTPNAAHVGPFTYTPGTWGGDRFPTPGNEAKLVGANGTFYAGKEDNNPIAAVILSGYHQTNVTEPVFADPFFFADGVGVHRHTHTMSDESEATIQAYDVDAIANRYVLEKKFGNTGGYLSTPVASAFWFPSPTVGGSVVSTATWYQGNTGYFGDDRDLDGQTGTYPGVVSPWPSGLAIHTMPNPADPDSGNSMNLVSNGASGNKWRWVVTFPRWHNPSLGVNPAHTHNDPHPHMRHRRNDATGHTVLLPRVQWFVQTNIPGTSPAPGMSSEVEGPPIPHHAEWVWGHAPDFAQAIADMCTNNQRIGRINYTPNV